MDLQILISPEHTLRLGWQLQRSAVDFSCQSLSFHLLFGGYSIPSAPSLSPLIRERAMYSALKL